MGDYRIERGATVSCGIWQTGLWNLEKFAVKNCGF